MRVAENWWERLAKTTLASCVPKRTLVTAFQRLIGNKSPKAGPDTPVKFGSTIPFART
jgi:hypothetical protein